MATVTGRVKRINRKFVLVTPAGQESTSQILARYTAAVIAEQVEEGWFEPLKQAYLLHEADLIVLDVWTRLTGPPPEEK